MIYIVSLIQLLFFLLMDFILFLYYLEWNLFLSNWNFKKINGIVCIDKGGGLFLSQVFRRKQIGSFMWEEDAFIGQIRCGVSYYETLKIEKEK